MSNAINKLTPKEVNFTRDIPSCSWCKHLVNHNVYIYSVTTTQTLDCEIVEIPIMHNFDTDRFVCDKFEQEQSND